MHSAIGQCLFAGVPFLYGNLRRVSLTIKIANVEQSIHLNKNRPFLLFS